MQQRLKRGAFSEWTIRADDAERRIASASADISDRGGLAALLELRAE
jgi:hypothetical protein